MTRVWDAFLTPNDQEHLAAYPADRKSVGRKPALLLVDLYRGAFGDEAEPLLESVKKWPSSCGLAGWRALPHIQRLLQAARVAAIPVVHLTMLEGVPGWRDETPRRSRVERPGADERRRRQHDIIDEVKPLPGEPVLGKSAPSAFSGTPLLGYLHGLGIDTLVIAGESTSGCIRATVIDGRTYRYKMLVVEECVFDRHEAPHAINLFDMDQKYANVVGTEEAIAYLLQNGTQPAQDK